MSSPRAQLNPVNPDIQSTSDTAYDALEQDFAENMANYNKSRCSRLTQYLGSFFKGTPKTATATSPAHPELNKVIVNPTFTPRTPGGSSQV
jgi:hypothetical protein